MASPLPETNTALLQWKTAHGQLVDAIDGYSIACTTFNSTVSSTFPSTTQEHFSLGGAVTILDAELQKFERQQQILATCIASLKKTRNLVCAVVPLNKLPVSLMTTILHMAVESELSIPTRLPPETPNYSIINTLSLVCSYWRDLIFRSHTIWSTIYLHQNDPECRSALQFLSRAGHAPLNIQAVFRGNRNHHNWLSLLQDKYEQIGSLDMVLPDMDLLHAALSSVNPAPALKSLSIKITRTRYEYGTKAVCPSILPHDAHPSFLSGVKVLNLYGGYFDWNSAVFTGLEHLRLAWIADPGPTLGQLFGMLRASPKLRTLCLAAIPILEFGDADTQPIHLENLETLAIMSFEPHELCKIVPPLCPGPLPLAVHLHLALETQATVEVFRALFQRSNVHSLYFHTSDNQRAMRDVLGATPSLQLLYVTKNEIAEVFWALSAPDGNIPTTLPCPRLHILCLYDCPAWFEYKPRHGQGHITDHPSLVIRHNSSNQQLLAYHAIEPLASGTVTFQCLESTLADEIPLHGFDHRTLSPFHEENESEDEPDAMDLFLIEDPE